MISKPNWTNLRQRVLSALIMVPLALLAVYFGGFVFALEVALVVGLGLREWLPLTRSSVPLSSLGIPYLGGFGFAVFYLRATPFYGDALVYYLLAVVWSTDIGAYAAGRLIGGPKLARIISPNKTWAGLLGGMALAGLVGYIAAASLGAKHPQTGLVLAIAMAVIAQLGDLFESWLKRCAGVKESGRLIPGHGGVLDRIDGLIFAAIFFALFQMVAGNGMKWWQ